MNRNRRRIIALSRYHHQEEMDGIAQYARKAGWALRFIITSENTIPANLVYDGILLIHIYHDEEMLNFVNNSSAPCMLADRKPWPFKMVPRVWYDLDAAFEMGINYFLSRSYQNIALLDFKKGESYFENSRDKIANAGRNAVVIDSNSIKEDLLKAPKPLAFMAPDDHWALEIYIACEELELQVPEQVALLGTSDTRHICEFNVVPLSSIDTQVSLCSYRAAEKLDALIDGKEVAETEYLLPKEIVVRESTAIPAIADHRVAKALKLIQCDFRQHIIFDDIADECGLNRWSLDLLFKKEFGSTMNTHLYDMRMNEASRLLKETDWPINRVGKAVSYENHVSFMRAFQKKFSCNPSEFRKKDSSE